MWPTLFKQQTGFGEVPYNSWGLMITLAFLFAAIVSHRRASRVGIDPDKLVGLYLLAIVLGLAGARLLHFLMATPDVFFADPTIFFRIWVKHKKYLIIMINFFLIILFTLPPITWHQVFTEIIVDIFFERIFLVFGNDNLHIINSC